MSAEPAILKQFVDGLVWRLEALQNFLDQAAAEKHKPVSLEQFSEPLPGNMAGLRAQFDLKNRERLAGLKLENKVLRILLRHETDHAERLAMERENTPCLQAA